MKNPSSNPDDDSEANSLRVFKPRRALPTDVVRPTRAEVNLSHLRHNLHLLRNASPPPTRIWAVVKADAYGHGARAVARTLERAGVDGICVALVEEGIELREAGITVPILVMGGYYGSTFREVLHHELTPVLHEAAQIEQLASTLEQAELPEASVHIKVDTGMSRLGARAADWKKLAETLAAHPRVRFQGLMTHFANADLDATEVLQEPLHLFEQARRVFADAGLVPLLRHAANSAALLRGGAAFDVVRPGIALFGVDPWPAKTSVGLLPSVMEREVLPKLKPVMSVHSRVVAVRELNAGDAVGYGSSWRAARTSRIATIPMGYADGLSRALSNKASLLVRGARAPIVGVVSMDMTMIDVTDVGDVAVGEDVVLLGSQKWPDERAAHKTRSLPGGTRSDCITANEIAASSGTIPWEVLTNISRRVPRFYREP